MRYALIRNAVRMSIRTFSTLSQTGTSMEKPSLIGTNQKDKPERVAWSTRRSLRSVIHDVSHIVQGVLNTDQVKDTPLGDRTAQQSTFQFLHLTAVLQRE